MSEQYNIPEPNSLDSMEGVNSSETKVELDEKENKALKKALESLKINRIDGASYYLIHEVNNPILNDLAILLFRVRISRSLKILMDSNNAMVTAHSPHHVGADMMRFDKKFVRYFELKEPQWFEIWRELCLLVITYSEEQHQFESVKYMYEDIGMHEKARKFYDKEDNDKSIPSDITKLPIYFDVITRIRQKFKDFCLTEEVENNIIQSVVKEINELIEN